MMEECPEKNSKFMMCFAIELKNDQDQFKFLFGTIGLTKEESNELS